MTKPARSAKEHDQQWICVICNTWHVVPSFARDCEKKHELEYGHGTS